MTLVSLRQMTSKEEEGVGWASVALIHLLMDLTAASTRTVLILSHPPQRADMFR